MNQTALITQRTAPLMRVVFALGAFLVFIIGGDLLLFPDHTDRLFAWTIAAPVSAAFLSGFYWTACVLAVLSYRRAVWSEARVGVLGVFLFVSITFALTISHLEVFHFECGGVIAMVVAFVWSAVYAVDPVLMIAAYMKQRGMPGVDAPRYARLPHWFRAILIGEATALWGVGIALLLVPATTGSIWPWHVEGLDARAMGAWVIALAAVVSQSAWEDAWEQIAIVVRSAVALAVLQLFTLARFHTAIERPLSALAYGAALVSLLAIGTYGTLAAERAERSA